MTRLRRWCEWGVLAAASLGVVACGGHRERPAPPPVDHVRRTVVWVGREGLDAADADLLSRVGVDGFAHRVGEMDLVGQVPVVKLYPEVPIESDLPISIVVRVTSLRPKLDPNAAIPVWGVLRDSLGAQRRPAGIILDLPVVKEGFDGFVANLAKVSRVPVTPLVTSGQLAEPEVQAVVRAAGTCSVLAYGAIGLERRGGRPSDHALRDQLAPLRGLGVRPRIAFVLRPEIRPPLKGWGEDLDPLTDPTVADISVHSELDRSFVFRRALTWSGHHWKPGQTVALRWMDVARLDAGLHEASTVSLPEVAGWDLIALPPPGNALGISREALLRYLRGEGPAFKPEVRVERRGRTVRVTLNNPSPFASAVSAYGSWVEVTLADGALVANDRGDFDRIVLGGRGEGGEWRRLVGAGMATAVRFYETYVAPEESLTTGVVRLPSRRSRVTVRWAILLSTGQELRGKTP